LSFSYASFSPSAGKELQEAGYFSDLFMGEFVGNSGGNDCIGETVGCIGSLILQCVMRLLQRRSPLFLALRLSRKDQTRPLYADHNDLAAHPLARCSRVACFVGCLTHSEDDNIRN
jgi:hypothetical protein